MSKIGIIEWIFVYIVAIIIDIVQIFFPGADLLADVFIGIGFFGYFKLRGLDLTKHPTRLISLLGFTAAAEFFSVGIAPAWIVDIFYIHQASRKDNAQFKQRQAEEEIYSNPRKPAYQDGVRLPSNANYNSSSPVNENGVRPPRLD